MSCLLDDFTFFVYPVVDKSQSRVISAPTGCSLIGVRSQFLRALLEPSSSLRDLLDELVCEKLASSDFVSGDTILLLIPIFENLRANLPLCPVPCALESAYRVHVVATNYHTNNFLYTRLRFVFAASALLSRVSF